MMCIVFAGHNQNHLQQELCRRRYLNIIPSVYIEYMQKVLKQHKLYIIDNILFKYNLLNISTCVLYSKLTFILSAVTSIPI